MTTPAMLYDILLASLGPQNWWPGDTPFEVAVGAVLTQNTAWTNVQKAIEALKSRGAMSAQDILALPPAQLEEIIHPAGFYRVKAGYLRTVSEWISHRAGGDLPRLAGEETALLRRELLELRGIGPETADSILLYAIGKPVFVVDAYTRRIGTRLGLVASRATYEQVQNAFTQGLPADVHTWGEFHALLVRLAKEHCRVRPICPDCPLADVCPSFTHPHENKRRHTT
ncbi:MAG: endonuclease III domain-containing protein [Candidatus Cryosericum sp.]